MLLKLIIGNRRNSRMRQIAIIYKRTRPEAAKLACDLEKWLQKRNVNVFSRENIDKSQADSCGYPKIEMPEGTDMVVVLGGDGTFLSVARFLENNLTPIVGINLGGMGFLTEISTDSCYREISQILDGHYEVEERMRLQISINRNGKEIFKQSVLNDAVINKGALARIVDLKTTINGRYLTHYRADGLIVATPTGSTAYNLSAGGPIVYPTSQAIILTPICPFTLTNRPIILPSDVIVQVELGAPTEDVALTCDGQVGCSLASSDRIVVSAGDVPLRLIKTPSIDYFQILRNKLKWGQVGGEIQLSITKP
jgi:NAD+ kinase